MKFLNLLLCLAGFCAPIFSQNFSYVTDRKFSDPTHLFGYDFRPAKMEIPKPKGDMGENEKRDLKPGSYSFGITQNNLYVEGEGIRGVYSVNNINTTEYGFQLLLMNARDPTLQGHLKVILNDRDEVSALVFRRSQKEKETIFHLPELPEDLAKKERKWFTGRTGLLVEAPDSLWGKRMNPFFCLHASDGAQQRLQMADSTSIHFWEEKKVIEKRKKPKKVKKDKKGSANEKEQLADSEGEIEVEVPLDSVAVDSAGVVVKTKIILRHYVKIRSILKYDDGTKEDKSWVYEIKAVKEKEDKAAGPEEERFQLVLATDKGGELYLYLTGRRTVSSFEMDDKVYLMRGF